MDNKEHEQTQKKSFDMFALADCLPKEPIVKSGGLARCKIINLVIGHQIYGRILEIGDVIRISEDCYNPIAYEPAGKDYNGVVYEPI